MGSVSSLGWTSTSFSWSAPKPGIDTTVVVECVVSAIFALVDVRSSIGVEAAFTTGDLLRSSVGGDGLGDWVHCRLAGGNSKSALSS